mgnify:CR=1 FL=1
MDQHTTYNDNVNIRLAGIEMNLLKITYVHFFLSLISLSLPFCEMRRDCISDGMEVQVNLKMVEQKE